MLTATEGKQAFVRDDGAELRVIPGFRRRVLDAPRVSVQPKPTWDSSDYLAAADKKLRGMQRVARELARFGGTFDGASVLEVGCGAGIDALLLATQPVERVVGIDLDLPVHGADDRGERTRRLTREVLDRAGMRESINDAFDRLPVQLLAMNATRMDFPDASFDLLVSRAALEHIAPIGRALSEMARVVRPGGLVRHVIDPFYWLRGCHKGGLIDIPWAHARLSPGEYRRCVSQIEGEAVAERRSKHLAGLNQLSLGAWRAAIEASPFEILDWQEDVSALAEAVLDEYPDVAATVLVGVTSRDLVHSSIKVWLGRPGAGRSGRSV